MIDDARRLAQGTEVDCDLCIVGAGAAGITLAREFAGGDVRVCVLESGGFEPEEATQELARGRASGTILEPDSPYLSDGRLRCFGGTTNLWTGWCRPFEPIDFEARPWVPGSGWPFDRSHLDVWYRRAGEVIGLALFDDEAVAASTGLPPLLPDDSRVSTCFFYLQPSLFGVVHRSALAAAPNVRVLLHANATGVRIGDGDRVRRIDAATLEGVRFSVRAPWFVLAAGGIETARLLLLSDDVREAGLGNERDLVGRYFSDHPHLDAGYALLLRHDESLDLFAAAWDGRLGHARIGVLSLSPEAQREHELLPCCVELRRSAAAAAPVLASEVAAAVPPLEPGALPPADRSKVTLAVRVAQTPNPESRVRLGEELDALGQRRVTLDWRIDPGDRDRILRALIVVGRELGRQGVGRVHLVEADGAPWNGAYGGYHHLGTTRMHPDPGRGVVDADCRVHSTANLFIAGSSVFPTFGFANPTLTLVALAIRLADHLKAKLDG